jgi:hypothetical protein
MHFILFFIAIGVLFAVLRISEFRAKRRLRERQANNVWVEGWRRGPTTRWSSRP